MPHTGHNRDPDKVSVSAWDLPLEVGRFAARFPGWLDERGNPRSWEAFVTGLRVLQHEEDRAFLVMARATRVAGAKDEDFERAMKQVSAQAGLG